MDPILIDVPDRLVTERLVLRTPRAGDGPKVWESMLVSLPELLPWMAWASEAEREDVAHAEAFARRARSEYEARRDFTYYGWAREPGPAGDGAGPEAEGRLLVACGLHRVDWTVRRFEIGYWRRTGYGGQGLVDEAVRALVALAFGTLRAERVEIRCDAANVRSARVAERCGFTLEGRLRRDGVTPGGEPRDTLVYAQVRGVEWPAKAA